MFDRLRRDAFLSLTRTMASNIKGLVLQQPPHAEEGIDPFTHKRAIVVWSDSNKRHCIGAIQASSGGYSAVAYSGYGMHVATGHYFCCYLGDDFASVAKAVTAIGEAGYSSDDGFQTMRYTPTKEEQAEARMLPDWAEEMLASIIIWLSVIVVLGALILVIWGIFWLLN